MRVVFLAVGVALASVGCSEDNPAGPTPVSSVTVAPANPGDTVFIGQTTQFTATLTLSNGQTEIRAGTWGSDNPAVATVDQNGLVTGVTAGEATIFADVNPRGATLVRVFPAFGGTWEGNVIVTRCEESGIYIGFNCGSDQAFLSEQCVSILVCLQQSGSSVTAVLDHSANADQTSTVNTSGTISTGGELRLDDASSSPGLPSQLTEQLNWRSRSDTPGVMTGTFQLRFTDRGGEPGAALLDFELTDYHRTALTSALSTGNRNIQGVEGLPEPKSRTR